MELIPSKDGTPIACQHSGAGAPVLMVHGTSGDHRTWMPVLPKLERFFTVWTMDRRGRGGSGDADDYVLQREAEDVAAVADAIATPVHVFGHSFGGLCALEAALLTPNIDRLMLYEPSLSLDGSAWSPEISARMRALLEEDRREEVLLLFLRDIAKMPADEIAALQQGVSWRAQIAAAHTVYRELRAIEIYSFDTARFRAICIPTALLLGAKSPKRRRVVVELLQETLLNSHIVRLPGQTHGAVHRAPDLVAEAAVQFFSAKHISNPAHQAK